MIIRKRVSAHWKHLDNTLVQQLKQTLQAVAVEAPQPSVRCVPPQIQRRAARVYSRGLPSSDPGHTVATLWVQCVLLPVCMSALPPSLSEAHQRNPPGWA